MENNRTETNNENVESIQEVMKRLSLAINVAQTIMPEKLGDYVPNALLNVTIARMIAIEGRDNTAMLLSKLSELPFFKLLSGETNYFVFINGCKMC